MKYVVLKDTKTGRKFFTANFMGLVISNSYVVLGYVNTMSEVEDLIFG